MFFFGFNLFRGSGGLLSYILAIAAGLLGLPRHREAGLRPMAPGGDRLLPLPLGRTVKKLIIPQRRQGAEKGRQKTPDRTVFAFPLRLCASIVRRVFHIAFRLEECEKA